MRAVDGDNGADDGNTVVLSGIPTGPVTTGTWTDDAGDTGPAKLLLSSLWSVQATGGKTGPKVYATGTYTNDLCASMTTPTISVQSTSALGFASKYDIETNWDAGIVEVSLGPSFGTWSRLTTVNYPDSLLNDGNGCGFPKSYGNTVFSRTSASPAYPASSYTGSLAAFAGNDIKLRWRLGSDATGTRQGWWVDDIAVTNAIFKQVCTPGIVASAPLEVSPDASPMLASRAVSGTVVDLSYTPACGAADNVVYWGHGPIAGSLSWTNAACAVGNTGTASFDPGDPAPETFVYFVIVGQSTTKEGSYGQGWSGLAGVERPEAVGIGACDRAARSDRRLPVVSSTRPGPGASAPPRKRGVCGRSRSRPRPRVVDRRRLGLVLARYAAPMRRAAAWIWSIQFLRAGACSRGTHSPQISLASVEMVRRLASSERGHAVSFGRCDSRPSISREARRQPREDRLEHGLVGSLLRAVQQVVDGAQLADEDHGGALEAADQAVARPVLARRTTWRWTASR